MRQKVNSILSSHAYRSGRNGWKIQTKPWTRKDRELAYLREIVGWYESTRYEAMQAAVRILAFVVGILIGYCAAN